MLKGTISAAKLDWPKADIFIATTTPYEEYRAANSCKKESHTVEWLEEYVKPGQVVYDIGANVGAYSLIAGHLVGETGMVYAMEPASMMNAALVANVRLNSMNKQVWPVHLALSDNRFLGVLNVFSPTSGAANHTLSKSIAGEFDEPTVVMQLDLLRTIFELKRPNHIKIDVDGHELQVVTGAKRTLKDPHLESVLIEIDEREINKKAWGRVGETMTSIGYTMLRKDELTEEQVFNCLFVKPVLPDVIDNSPVDVVAANGNLDGGLKLKDGKITDAMGRIIATLEA